LLKLIDLHYYAPSKSTPEVVLKSPQYSAYAGRAPLSTKTVDNFVNNYANG